jgi:tetratricopeptide (TPR) repeat protein
LEQDPVSGAVWHNLGLICHAAGLLDESETALRRALDLGPQRLVTTAMLSLVVAEKGNLEQAVELAEREPDQLWRLWALAIIYFRSGDNDRAHRILDTIIDEHADGDAFQIGEIFAVGGEIDKAFEWLERAIAERDPGVTHVVGSPRFRTLHADPRWPALLKTIGFEDLKVV